MNTNIHRITESFESSNLNDFQEMEGCSSLINKEQQEVKKEIKKGVVDCSMTSLIY